MCDCDEALAYWPRLVRARKRHQCRECPASIEPGEVHEVASGIWPDGPSMHRTCLPCAEVRQQLMDDLAWDDCPPCFGQLSDHLAEACSQRR